MNDPTAAPTGAKPIGLLTVAALGVVYGDIGTSPLYTLREVFASPHHPVPINPESVCGILSLIFWSLILIVSLKYVLFITRADNRGEGGILALTALAMRPTETGSRIKSVILVLGLFGTALFYGDGAITPAISVLSAIEGLEIAAPSLEPYVVPVTLSILTLLFMVQRHGTGRIGALFGPITAAWFLALGLLGISGILGNPGVLAALDPQAGLRFLDSYPLLGFFSLGAVFLSITGAEALYADMGHFGRRPIQLAWFLLVLPALVLNYFGQGALLLSDPTSIEHPFYRLVPEWGLYPMVGLATVATIIASQAVITGAFSITHQAIQLGFAPRMEVQHTSDEDIGQIYVPAINWLLLSLVIALVIGFGTSTRLAAAYGIAVTGTMVITTLMAAILTRYLWRWPWLKVLLVLLPFLAIDLGFFSANLIKVTDGGWFPLVFGCGSFLLLSTWRWGRKLLRERLDEDAIGPAEFVEHFGIQEVRRIPGTAVYLNANPAGIPHALLHSLKHFKVLHERMVLATVVVRDVPRLKAEERVKVEYLNHGFWQVQVAYGYAERIDLPRHLALCIDHGLVLDMMNTSFFLGRETLIPRSGTLMAWRSKLFVALFRNAGGASAYFHLPPNRVVELGTQVVL